MPNYNIMIKHVGLQGLQGAPIKQSLRKNLCFSNGCMDLSQTFTTYPAYFIEITDVFQRIQQFKHTEYSRITNQTLHSFSAAVETFQ